MGKQFFQFFLPFVIFCIFSCGKTVDFKSNFAVISSEDSMEDIIRKAANITPSERQYNWQKLETTAFVHFTINTFTDREWGDGREDPRLFNPTNLDAGQWAEVCRESGLKMIIVTAKHHDGFCLWPSKYTDHSVKSSPWKDGKGDVVGEVSSACKKYGLKFGIYLSPWDRHEQTYGTDQYNEYFKNQLRELLTNYGKVDEVWFDGACGEGPNGKMQVYDWQEYYKVIRELQPESVIAIMGNDVRWVGTESGYGRKTEWSVIPVNLQDPKKIIDSSQKELREGAFIPKDLTEEDLGSRDKIKNAKTLVWYPSEVDVSIRPGWFYHESQDDLVKTPEKLLDIYFNSVGRNSLLLLNIPPDRRGLIHENDAKALREWKYAIDMIFRENLAEGAAVNATNVRRGNFHPSNTIDNNEETYWITEQNTTTAGIEYKLDEQKTFDILMLQENILVGQRIESFYLEIWKNEKWNKVAEGTTVGYKRLLRFPAETSDKVRLIISKSRQSPTLLSFGLYKRPPKINFEPKGGTFIDKLSVKLISDDKDAKIFYTTDGTEPSENSDIYHSPVVIKNNTEIRAVAVNNKKVRSFVYKAAFSGAKYGVKYNTLYSQKYKGAGNFTLVDGVKGSLGFNDGKWQGFEKDNLDIIVDLGKVRKLEKISASFLQDIKSWIFLPEKMKIELSTDGTNFSKLPEVFNSISRKKEGAFKFEFTQNFSPVKARYVHITAQNLGVCPDWHHGAGGKA